MFSAPLQRRQVFSEEEEASQQERNYGSREENPADHHEKELRNFHVQPPKRSAELSASSAPR
jgi:hypothetical protein